MTRDNLFDALVRLCQAYGYTTQHTYDLLRLAVDSVETTHENEED